MIDWLLCTLVKLLGAVLCRLPASAAIWLGEQLGALAYFLQPRRTQVGINNLRAAFDGQKKPKELRRIIYHCYKQLGAGIFELLRLPVVDKAYIDRYITPEGKEHFDKATAGTRPLVLLTGHYGSWEMTSIAAALYGYPIVALARAQKNFPKLYHLLVSYRESKGCIIVHKGGAMRQLIEALSSGKLVGIVGDQASRYGIFVDFFGRPASFATGPFELAYRKKALILLAFIRRTRGPRHRLVIEPPIDLSKQADEKKAVQEGITHFACALARHVAEDPTQWLWMHKRWKHTPARRALILSDGKAGHVKQSLAVAESLRERFPELAYTVVEVRYRSHFARAMAVLLSWLPRGFNGTGLLAYLLTKQSGRSLLSRYADIIISCGSSTAPVNLLWAAENRAKSIVIMNPGAIPLSRFDLAIVPRHDAVPDAPNVVRVSGAVAASPDRQLLDQAATRLTQHPRYRPAASSSRAPAIAVLIGGDTQAYRVTESFTEALLAQVLRACQRSNSDFLVTTSRRTSPAAARLLSERLEAEKRCRMLLLAGRDALNGTLEGMLGLAEIAVVTGESVSMISEACASGRCVIVVLLPQKSSRQTKHERFLRELAEEGHVQVVPVEQLEETILQVLAGKITFKRLDSLAAVKQALARLS